MNKPNKKPESPRTPLHTIAIAGDIIVDHHLYEGERWSPSLDARQGVRVKREHGGAALIGRLLNEAQVEEHASGDGQAPAGRAGWNVWLGTQPPELSADPCKHHAYAVWTPHYRDPREKKDDKRVWRADKLMGYGHDSVDAPSTSGKESGDACCHAYAPVPAVAGPAAPPTRILVLDDAGFVFRHRANQPAWLLPGKNAKANVPDWIVLKMSRPVAQGELWNDLIARFADRLVVIVSANELRADCVALSRGLSWERTVEDLQHLLARAPLLRGLTKCRHLIVSFSADGALWLDHGDRKAPRATLVFDPGHAEGQWADTFAGHGEAFGFLSCLTASISRALMQDVDDPPAKRTPPAPFDLAPAISAGLAAMRELGEFGHGPANQPPDGFPARHLAPLLRAPGRAFASLPVPWAEDAPKPLQLVLSSQQALGEKSIAHVNLNGLARQVVLRGLGVLQRLPHGCFGDLFTADRAEIETLRTIQRLMAQYKARHPAAKPLSIGVFGPPGAGKSFGVKQLAHAIFGPKAWHEFNLSQFKDAGDLIGAFHALRDAALSGICPVAFWDEFDSREYEWLQYLLAPMQDGRFQEGLANHSIGPCVFIFAGATSATFAGFGPKESAAAAWRKFKLSKGPDFQSRLDTYYDVLGPNVRELPPNKAHEKPRRDPADVCAPLRRALVIRHQLSVPPDGILDFDSDLLDALLETQAYRHGSRSVEKIVTALRPGPGTLAVRRSSLPPAQVLAMHLDLPSFGRVLSRNEAFRSSAIIGDIAAHIHDAWWKTSRSTAEGREKLGGKPHLDHPYRDLAETDRETNRAAARRIPDNLSIAGLKLRKRTGRVKPEAQRQVGMHIRGHLDRLAESEHIGWMADRLGNGWCLAKTRDDGKKLHPCLIPFDDLPEIEKEKDRATILGYAAMLADAGYEIVFAGS